MNCRHCKHAVPEDAAFCIYCGAARTSELSPPAAATGETIRLDRAPHWPEPRARTYTSPLPSLPRKHGRHIRNHGGNWGWVPLVFVFLFVTGWWWPGMFLFWIGPQVFRGRHRGGWHTIVIFLLIGMGMLSIIRGLIQFR
ncbi:MAG: hypothetical protein NVS2B7_35750 [Herpetosiphon sp.]